MDMLEIFKNLLKDGMKITDLKNYASKYKITLSYNGMSASCELAKKCAPGMQEIVCKKAIDTAISTMYINTGNYGEAKRWLDGEAWNKGDVSSKYEEEIMRVLRKKRNLSPDDTSEDTDIMKMPKRHAFYCFCEANGILSTQAYTVLQAAESIFGAVLE